jgi:hypothetical protein
MSNIVSLLFGHYNTESEKRKGGGIVKKGKKIMPPPMVEDMNLIGLGSLDPLGSYTGVPVFEDEEPVQDADDL